MKTAFTDLIMRGTGNRVESGAKLTIKSGATLEAESGSTLTGIATTAYADAAQAAAIAASDTAGAASAAQAYAVQRANHTGTQTLSTISDAGDAAGKNTGTTAGTVAAGDDARLQGYPSSGNQGTLSLTADTTLADATHKPYLKVTPSASGWKIRLDGLSRYSQKLKNASATYTMDVYDSATFICTMTDGMGWVEFIKDADNNAWGF